MAPVSSAVSSTVRVMGPAASMDQEMGHMRYRLSRPQVGRRPTMPQKEAGPRMEPPVSSPRAMAHRDAAMAMPEPVLELPG